MSGHRNVMAVVIFQRIGIFDLKNFFIAVSDDNRSCAGCNALFGAFFSGGIRAFHAALGVADPTVHRLCVGSKRNRSNDQNQRESQRTTKQFSA